MTRVKFVLVGCAWLAACDEATQALDLEQAPPPRLLPTVLDASFANGSTTRLVRWNEVLTFRVGGLGRQERALVLLAPRGDTRQLCRPGAGCVRTGGVPYLTAITDPAEDGVATYTLTVPTALGLGDEVEFVAMAVRGLAGTESVASSKASFELVDYCTGTDEEPNEIDDDCDNLVDEDFALVIDGHENHGNQGVMCIVTPANDLRCWGGDGAGQVSGAAAHPKAQDVAVGGTFVCALGLDGLVSCWGSDRPAVWRDPPAIPFVDIDGGGSFACGIDELGEVQCWGDVPWDFVGVPAGPWDSLSMKYGTVCALDSGGFAACGSSSNVGVHELPRAVSEGPVRDVAGGPSGAIAITDRGEGWVWGLVDRNYGSRAEELEILNADIVTAGNDNWAICYQGGGQPVSCFLRWTPDNAEAPDVSGMGATTYADLEYVARGLCGIAAGDGRVVCAGEPGSGIADGPP